jgi:hypothetical protein
MFLRLPREMPFAGGDFAIHRRLTAGLVYGMTGLRYVVTLRSFAAVSYTVLILVDNDCNAAKANKVTNTNSKKRSVRSCPNSSFHK